MKKLVLMILLIFIINGFTFSQDSTDDISDTTVPKVKNGWDYYKEGRYHESIRALLSEKKYYPQRINIYVILGWDYKKTGNFAQMEKESLEGLRVDPNDRRVVFNLAEAYFFQKKYNEAIPILQKYIALKNNENDPFLSTIYYYLGESFYNLEYYRKADISLSTANYYNPKNINTLLRLALINEKLDNLEKAKNFYDSILSINPENIDAKQGIERLN